MGWEYKQNPKKDYFDQIMDILDDVRIFLILTIFFYFRMIYLINKHKEFNYTSRIHLFMFYSNNIQEI